MGRPSFDLPWIMIKSAEDMSLWLIQLICWFDWSSRWFAVWQSSWLKLQCGSNRSPLNYGMAIEINEVTATVYHKNQKTMSQGSKQTTSNYAHKPDERRKQVHKHYQTRTGDYLQELWNHYTLPRRQRVYQKPFDLTAYCHQLALQGSRWCKVGQLHTCTHCPKDVVSKLFEGVLVADQNYPRWWTTITAGNASASQALYMIRWAIT